MTKYNLKKGKFSSSGIHIGLHTGTTEETCKVKFSKECLYNPIDRENDYNKLCGWSYGILPVKHQPHFSAKPDFRLFGVDYVWAHHYNSIRVAWRPKNKHNIELAWYTYQEGIRTTSGLLSNIGADKDHYICIQREIQGRGFRLFLYNNKELSGMPLLSSLYAIIIKPTWGYRLFPYFGANNPAPHDMSIELERL